MGFKEQYLRLTTFGPHAVLWQSQRCKRPEAPTRATGVGNADGDADGDGYGVGDEEGEGEDEGDVSCKTPQAVGFGYRHCIGCFVPPAVIIFRLKMF